MHRFRLSSLGGRSFFCAAPSLWNTLPVTVTDSSLSLHSFLGHLKTFFFSLYPPAIERARVLPIFRAIQIITSLHFTVHWLDLPRRVLFKICVMVYKSLHSMAHKYLVDLCRPISDVQRRRHLRSAARGLLHTPRYYLSTYGRRALSYASPSARNSLLEYSRASDLSLNSFRHSLKTFLFTLMTHAVH